jgi:hypothetical protein
MMAARIYQEKKLAAERPSSPTFPAHQLLVYPSLTSAIVYVVYVADDPGSAAAWAWA